MHREEPFKILRVMSSSNTFRRDVIAQLFPRRQIWCGVMKVDIIHAADFPSRLSISMLVEELNDRLKSQQRSETSKEQSVSNIGMF